MQHSQQKSQSQSQQPQQLDTSPCPRFRVPEQLPQALRFLERQGFVVFADVASASDRHIAEILFWDWCETVGSSTFKAAVDRTQPSTWHYVPLQAATGIVSTCGIGQSEFQWFLRTLPRVRQLYEAIWKGEPNLLVSFDGCGVFRPVDVDATWKTDGGWYHVDQNPKTQPDKACVQGLLSVFAQTVATGGLVVIPGSHKSFQKLAPLVTPATDTTAYLRPPERWLASHPPTHAPKLVTCEAGDFICWDSRTLHCNTPGLPSASSTATSSSSVPSLQRLVSYICMVPFPSALTPKEAATFVAKRSRAAKAFETHTHWPSLCLVASVVGSKKLRAELTQQAQQDAHTDTDRQRLITGQPLA